MSEIHLIGEGYQVGDDSIVQGANCAPWVHMESALWTNLVM